MKDIHLKLRTKQTDTLSDCDLNSTTRQIQMEGYIKRNRQKSMSTKIEQEAIQIRCIIVDDEPMARDVLRRYIQLVPALTLVEEFSNAVDAFMFLQVQQIDLIFLDIRMPEMTGIQFLQSLRNP